MNITDIDDKIIRGAAAAGDRSRTWPTATWPASSADADALRMTTPDVLPRATEHIDEIVDAHRDAARAGPRLSDRRRLDLLPDRLVAGLRPPGPARSGAAPGRRAGRGRRVRQGRRPRLRALEGPEARRTVVGDGHRRGPAGLAHRVLGDEHGPPRAVVRHPYRRRRPDLPAPRGRDRPERGRDRAAVRRGRGSTAPTCRSSGSKMAKSTGNIARVGELLDAGVSPRALRYALIAVHYRAGPQLLDDSLAAAGAARRAARRRSSRPSRRTARTGRTTRRSTAPRRRARDGVRRGARRRPQRLRRPWPPCSTSSATSTAGSRRGRSRPPTRSRRSTALRDLDRVLGGPARRRRRASTPTLQALLDERAAARAARDWAASDRLRDELADARDRRRGHPRRPALATLDGGDRWLTDRDRGTTAAAPGWTTEEWPRPSRGRHRTARPRVRPVARRARRSGGAAATRPIARPSRVRGRSTARHRGGEATAGQRGRGRATARSAARGGPRR